MQTQAKAKSFLMSVVQNLDVVHAVLYSVCTVLSTTPKWSEINLSDRILIGLATQGVVFTDNDECVVEIPAYLPKSDPDVSFRFHSNVLVIVTIEARALIESFSIDSTPSRRNLVLFNASHQHPLRSFSGHSVRAF